MKFTSPETRMIVLPDSENCMIIDSFVWRKHQNLMDRWTDGQTDRQTDRQKGCAITALASNADAL